MTGIADPEALITIHVAGADDDEATDRATFVRFLPLRTTRDTSSIKDVIGNELLRGRRPVIDVCFSAPGARAGQERMGELPLLIESSGPGALYDDPGVQRVKSHETSVVTTESANERTRLGIPGSLVSERNGQGDRDVVKKTGGRTITRTVSHQCWEPIALTVKRN